MNTIHRAMLWELWRTNRTDLLSRVGFLLGGILWLRMAPIVQDMSEPQVQVSNGIFVFLLAIVSASSATCWMQLDRQNSGFSFRLGFTRPVSTTQLVAVPMIFMVICSLVCYVLPALVLSYLLGRSIPIVGPCALIVCVAAWFMAACWSPSSLTGKLLALALLAMSVIGVLLLDHAFRGNSEPLLLALGKEAYFDFGLPVYLSMLPLAGLAFCITTVCVDRQRHGESWLWSRTASLESGAGCGQGARVGIPLISKDGFRSRFHAQCSYELQRFGRTVIGIACLIAVLALALVSLLPLIQPNWRSAHVVWVAALLLSPLALHIVGLDGALGIRNINGSVRLSAFDATRTLTNVQLVGIKLWMVTSCAFAGWVIVGIVGALHMLAAGYWPRLFEIVDALSEALGGISTGWLAAALLCAIFLYISSCSILMVLGLWLPLHPRIFAGLSVFFYACSILLIIDVANKGTFHPLWMPFAYVLAASVLVACTILLRRAYREGVLHSGLFLGTFALWLVYVTTGVVILVKFLPSTSPPALIVLGAATWLIPLAATAVAPIALAAHRNA